MTPTHKLLRRSTSPAPPIIGTMKSECSPRMTLGNAKTEAIPQLSTMAAFGAALSSESLAKVVKSTH